MIFIIDSSGSIGEDNWQKILKFMEDVVLDLKIGVDVSIPVLLTNT